MNRLYKNFKNSIKELPTKVIHIVQLFLATDMPLYSANAAFFLIVSGIPISMILFSLVSLVPYVKFEDFTVYIHNLFPDISYIGSIVEYITTLARSLASTKILSMNILIAIISGSTTFYSFIIGIRKIHNITYRSSFIALRILALVSTIFFFIANIMMIMFFLFGSMILRLANTYAPVLYNFINNLLSFKYVVAFVILLVVMLSIYTTSTNYERRIRHNFLGAFVSTSLWLIVSNLFSIYFSHFSLNANIYGSLSGIVVFLLWVYVCMNILYLGAAINEIFIPEEKIIEERNLKTANAFFIGNDTLADKEIDKLYKKKKIKKFQRPNTNTTNKK